ncbi:PREDICTED: uncharacterized protein LOC109236045 [Nicotiana attenuata]|uniref:uncharacterized protein LOC109236045 n=1 Tax=Nicotiana attenuata TaxID=49451 RepID=UPI00090520C8|nr:PREDICTED: uncharacterized protein LOC109236045 [Nicotiana attenuata]
MVKAFFCGHELPKFVTHTNLVLLPKKKVLHTFSDLRPISLSNFTNKIISRVVHERLVDIMPNVISDEQAGFVKGRSIVEDVLLTQEIITDIRLRTKVGPNVVLKLGMMKAYDRLSWLFLTKVLRKMGFLERFIGLMFGIVSNNWYSVLVNGQPYGFFKSTRAMSRGLNALHMNLYFCGFGLPKWSPKINHLAYADDTIIFSSSDAMSLRLIMEVLKSYEIASGQLINTTKSAVYVHHSTNEEVVRKIERITGLGRKEFPFTYLGCPIFYSRRRIDFYEGLITKVLDRIQTWKGKLLSIGGRAVFITSVLQSMPIHLLSAVNPPANVINKLHKLFARFFWSNLIDGRARHWASWDTLCLPYDERGLGSLYFITPPDFFCDETINNVNDVVIEGRWNDERIKEILPNDLATHILENIPCPARYDELDKPVWSLEVKGNFSVKSAWEYLRRRRDTSITYANIWVKGLPFKISFFMWKLWKGKLPLDDTLRRMGYFMPSKCWCCIMPNEESVGHIFFRSFTASRVWNYFFSYAGLSLEGLTLYQAIVKCWTVKVIPRLKPIFQALPSIIVWELWKRRNSNKHGEPVTTNRVVYQVCTTIQSLIKVRKPRIVQVPFRWPNILRMMENYTPRLKISKVLWEFPMHGWTKINTDGASRGNPGSSIGFCLRNEHGDLMYACGKEIQQVTNTQAESMAILEALNYCVDNEISNIWFQTDSMLLKNVIEGN